ncbi:MAG: response regulator [Gammaproteobacteria bacterium]|nr:response regulator [Gammaproteobacteria bacterium]
MKDFLFRLSIGKKLVLSMVLISGLITFLMTALQLYAFYVDGLSAIEKRLAEIESVHVPDITERLWVSDFDNIKGHVNTLVKFDGVQAIHVLEQNSLVYGAAEGVVNSDNVKNFVLRYRYRNENVDIGSLVVYLEYDSLYDSLFFKAVSIFVSNALKTFVVGFAILLLFNYLVTRHLVVMASFFNSLDKSISGDDLILDRHAVEARNDELDIVVSSVNSMKHSAQKYFHDLVSSNKDLVLYKKRMEHLKELMERPFYSEAEILEYGLESAVKFSQSMAGDLFVGSLLHGNHITYLYGDVPDAKHDLTVCMKCMSDGPVVVEFGEYGVCALDGVNDTCVVRKLCVPINSHNNVEGIISVYDRDFAYSDDDVIELELFVRSMWSLIQRRRSQYELELSQKSYKTLLETSAAIPWTMDISSFSYSHVGVQIEKLFGYSLHEWYDPLFQRQHIHPNDLHGVIEKQKECMANNSDYRAKYRFYDKSGRERWVLDAGRLVAGQNQVDVIQGFMFEITEQEHHDQILRRTQKMEAMDTLAGGIAHDYNNMLGVIMGYSQLITESPSADKTLSKYNAQIYQAALRGSNLTKKLLKFSKQRSQEASGVMLNRILLDDEDMLRKTLTPKVSLKFELDENLAQVYIDKNGIENAILNLCINASHAMPSGGDLIIRTENTFLNRLEAEKYQLPEGAYVSCSIIDSGIGMAESIQERIFDPFFSTKGDKGTGLGLSQVYGLVRASEGMINVISEPGRGTTMSILLPVYHTSEQPEERENIVDIKMLQGTESILVVDDEVSIRDMAVEILSLNGYVTDVASGGEDALQKLSKGNYHMVLSDVIMPGMSGYQLAHKIRELYPTIKIQLNSGFNDDCDRNEEDDELYENVINKPYSTRELLTQIRKMLDA